MENNQETVAVVKISILRKINATLNKWFSILKMICNILGFAVFVFILLMLLQTIRSGL